MRQTLSRHTTSRLASLTRQSDTPAAFVAQRCHFLQLAYYNNPRSRFAVIAQLGFNLAREPKIRFGNELQGHRHLFGVGMRFLTISFVIILFALGDSWIDAQTTQKNWRLDRQRLDQLYADDLQQLANERRADGDSSGAKTVLEQFQVRDPQRQYIFLPTEDFRPTPVDPTEVQLEKVHAAHAERIFELAKNAATQGDGAESFQFLHEVLYFNSKHAEVRKILAHRRTETGWRVASEKIRLRQGTKTQQIMGWKSKSYLQITTAHFVIESTADEAATVALAEKLERWHGVWRQIFFEFWSNGQAVERWIQGRGAPKNPSRKFQVIFFPDKESYAEQLEPQIPGISASSGYYSDALKASFFYAGEETTWRHELTHQLLQETRRSSASPFEENFLWLGEGIAMYMESLNDFGDYVTLGGFDAQRLQYARIRIFRERFFVEPVKLTAMTQAEFQSSEDRGQLYSQSAGMCHFLMNGGQGVYRANLIEFLKLIYQGKLKKNTFEKIVGLDDASFQDEYFEYLKTPNETIEQFLLFPLSRTEFSLGNANISQTAMEQIGKCTNLQLLDLSENRIDATDLELIADCDRIDEIFLSNCKIEPGSLKKLAELEGLKTIDLAASNCTDSEFLALGACRGLKSVSVMGTSISDSAISRLKTKLPNLEVRK